MSQTCNGEGNVSDRNLTRGPQISSLASMLEKTLREERLAHGSPKDNLAWLISLFITNQDHKPQHDIGWAYKELVLEDSRWLT